MAVNNMNNNNNEVNFVKVESDKVAYVDGAIESTYEYTSTLATRAGDGKVTLKPETTTYRFQTKTTLPKLGCMLVGLGGNNGSTVVAGALANKKKMSWKTKAGEKTANYYGSITQCSTLPVGRDAHGAEVFVGFNEVVPMVSPSDIVWSGWDISKMNLADAMERSKVLDWDLQRQLRPEMEKIVPLPSIFNVDFVAGNQQARADNVKTGTIEEQMNEVRADIRRFKADNALDKVIVLWTANTERFAEKIDGLNDTADNLLAAIKRGESEVSPSTLFAVACILEGVCFINGSPQNTFVPGCIELALRHNVPIGGDDFKSGQTKFKSVLVDFLVNAGIKPRSIMSYNHLGNNDGLNLSVQKTFRSKEVSKSNVVDDMVASNHRLYEKDEHPDHTIVIKYCPFVADSKRAMDEYTSEIFLGGHNTLVVHNTCEDSLLATPIIYDLVILAELTQRISYKVGESATYETFHPVLSLLSYLCKAPLVPDGRPVINALFKQRAAIDNLLRACVGLPAENNMRLEDVRFTGVSAEAKAAAQADLTKTVPSVVKVGGAAPTIA